MGLDLRLLPAYSQDSDLSFDILDCERDYDFFDIIKDIESQHGVDVPQKGIHSFSGTNKDYEGICYGDTKETAYGEIMKGI